MNKFSERHGFKTAKTVIQKDCMDVELRTSLWNSFYITFLSNTSVDYSQEYKTAWVYCFKLPLNDAPYAPSKWEEFFKKYFNNAKWYEIYDFLEFIIRISDSYISEKFCKMLNRFLEIELSGYRIIQKIVTPIVDDLEIDAISEASVSSDKFSCAGTHIKSALSLMSDRKNPDFRNSIKESISAVESVCKIIANDTGATLGSALKTLETNKKIHGSLKSAFDKLYGYTSDKGGIRHAMIDESDLDFDDAKFMLVACSGFINFLKSKIAKEL